MGRSFLSIKLALIFGLGVGALVLQVERGRDVAPQPVHGSAAVAGPAVPTADAGEIVCMWRGCPLVVEARARTVEQRRSG
jgi:hypothetical protein